MTTSLLTGAVGAPAAQSGQAGLLGRAQEPRTPPHPGGRRPGGGVPTPAVD